jgi:hypothetical protein
MAAFDPATLDRWRALAIVDRDGTTVGTINEFYLDRETGHPTWALVNTGLFGTTQTFVPLVHATELSDGLQVPYEKRHIRDSPKVDLHDELSPDEEAALFAHYGVDYQLQPPADAEPGPAEGPGPVPAGAGLTGSPAAVDTEPAPGEAPGPVPADPGAVDTEPGTAPPDPGAPVPDEPGTADDPADRSRAAPASPNDPVPDEPGTTRVEVGDGEWSGDDRGPSGERPGAEFSERPADPDLGPSRATAADPDLSRTAPVAEGLPGSTASSPYGVGPPTVDKGADPSGLPAEEPPRPPAEAGWAPGAGGSLEEPEPVDQPDGASDRWREAKLAAERDRIARAAAAQPEERSPLERARRRLERLVGGGQDHPDPEDISPADREAAERARRARLGLDEEDNRRNR